MKKYVFCIGLILLAALMILSGCGTVSGGTDATAVPENTDVPATKAPETTEVPAATEEPAVTEEPSPTEVPTPSPVPTGDPSIEKGTNVALLADVDVSSTTGELHVQWGWSYEFINDGVILPEEDPWNIGWTTAVGDNYEDPEQEEWVEFVLNKYTSIDTVKVYPARQGQSFPVDFHVEVSLDGKTYTTVASLTDQNQSKIHSNEPSVLTFEPVTARYVRFVVTKQCDELSGNDGYLVQIAEIEILAA